MSFALTTCSTTDLSHEYLKSRDIGVVFFHFQLGEKEYPDDMGVSVTPKELFRRMLDGEDTKTSQVTMGEYMEFFEPILKEGKDILHIAFSSGLSGSYNSARLAAEDLAPQYPDRKIYVVDSLAASTGHGLVVDKAADLRDEGKSIDEVRDWIEANKNRAHHWFFSTDLTFFIRGGRVSKTAGTIGTLVGYSVAKQRRSKWANYVNSVAFLPYLMPSIAVGAALFVLLSSEKINLFNTYWILIIAGTIKYIPFASRSSLNSMLQLSGEIEEAAIIQDIPWIKRMLRIIIPIQKSSIISGYLLPFMTCLRELSLFMLLCVQGFILSTTLDYFDEMGLYAFSSGINLLLIITILIFNTLVNKLTGASLDEGIGG